MTKQKRMSASGAWSRRAFVQSLAATGAIVATGGALSSCARDTEEEPQVARDTEEEPQAESSAVVFSGFGGTAEEQLRRAVFDDFESETGISVFTTTGAFTPAQLRGMVDAGRTEWDIVRVFSGTLGEYIRLDLIEEIDYDSLAMPEVISDAALSRFAVNYNQYAHPIFWNADLIDSLANWEDVFNIESFPGLRGFSDTPFFHPEAAMIASGRSIDEVYPIDIDLYLEMLDQVRPSARFLGNEPLTSLIADGSIATGHINLNRLIPAIEAGQRIEYHWHQALTDMSGLAIPKGAPNRDAAYRLIEFFMRHESQMNIQEELPTNSPVVASAFEEIPENLHSDMAGSPVTVQEAVYLDGEWYAENGEEIGRRFSDWLRSG